MSEKEKKYRKTWTKTLLDYVRFGDKGTYKIVKNCVEKGRTNCMHCEISNICGYSNLFTEFIERVEEVKKMSGTEEGIGKRIIDWRKKKIISKLLINKKEAEKLMKVKKGRCKKEEKKEENVEYNKFFEIWCEWNRRNIDGNKAMGEIGKMFWKCGLQKYWIKRSK